MHTHICRCGLATLECARDDCAVIEPWQCPTCDANERDAFWQAEELDYLNPNQPEPTTTEPKEHSR